jgi:hypothetical protein
MESEYAVQCGQWSIEAAKVWKASWYFMRF